MQCNSVLKKIGTDNVLPSFILSTCLQIVFQILYKPLFYALPVFLKKWA